MVKLRVSLSPDEADALARLAYFELRDPRDQIRFILCRELERLGLLQPTPITKQKETKDGT